MRSLSLILIMLVCISKAAFPQSQAVGRKQLIPYKVSPEFEKISGLKGEYREYVKQRLDTITEGWLIPAPHANPMMINMFRMRDRERDDPGEEFGGTLMPWQGKYIGEHLLSAQLIYRMSRNPELKASIDNLVQELIAAQGEDGYLGPFPESGRFGNNWDYWGHYHVIQALLMYYQDTGWEPALDSALKAADLIDDTLLEKNKNLNEMNSAIIHGMTNLYLKTGDPRYLRTARWVVDRWNRPESLKYVSLALEGKPLVEFPAHRWESAYSWLGISEMYLITGEKNYLKAYSHIWRDALKGDRHNTGGWTAGEGIQNNPYHQGAIETCCTVAWIALSLDMLRLTGNSIIADEMELSTWNGGFGCMHPSGRWGTYNTPMDGVRISIIDISTRQHKAGSHELVCCSVNVPRALGMIQEWAVMKTTKGFALNWYGPYTLTVPLDSGGTLILDQKTKYPSDGYIRITIGLKKPHAASLKLRIPSWSAKTVVKLNGENVKGVEPGSYLELDRTWHNGDSIELLLDMSPHFWVGERECKGKISVYTGPVLLAWDQRFNEEESEDVPALDAQSIELVPLVDNDYPRSLLLYRVKSGSGSDYVLCDFATAGMTGTLYSSWLPVKGIQPFKAESKKPVWTAR